MNHLIHCPTCDPDDRYGATTAVRFNHGWERVCRSCAGRIPAILEARGDGDPAVVLSQPAAQGVFDEAYARGVPVTKALEIATEVETSLTRANLRSAFASGMVQSMADWCAQAA